MRYNLCIRLFLSAVLTSCLAVPTMKLTKKTNRMTVSDAVLAVLVAVAWMLIAVIYYLRPDTRFGYARVETVHTRVQVTVLNKSRGQQKAEKGWLNAANLGNTMSVFVNNTLW